MFDFRLKVFYTVARRLNFTKAAKELFITQPAVTRHIHEIESFYKCQLFERNGTKIKLTQAGVILLKYAEELFAIYRNIEFDLASANEAIKGTLRLGASTTIAQYILPKYFATFRKKFPEVLITMTTGNTEDVEKLLVENQIDLGVIEGKSKRPQVKYVSFLKDEIVLVANNRNPAVVGNVITIKDLTKLPLVMREQGSGSLEVIHYALKEKMIDPSQLNIEVVLDSTESIKNYLMESGAYAFLSIHSVLKELAHAELRIVDIKDFSIDRHFHFISRQGDANPLCELFLRFLSSDNLK